jgi:DNA-binding transcriptional ArsR family regulator
MTTQFIVKTTGQKVLFFLAKFSDREFYERQLARKITISYGSANAALNELYASGSIRRRQAGKMFFYSINSNDAAVKELKKLVNLFLIEPLVSKVKKLASGIIMYGDCARGIDNSLSELNLFIATGNKPRVSRIIRSYKFPGGYESVKFQPLLKTIDELLIINQTDKSLTAQLNSGIILWKQPGN